MKSWLRSGIARLAVLAGAGILTACNGPGAPLPLGPPIINIRMTEFHFSNPPTVPHGRVQFRAHNNGRLAHRLLLIPLPNGFPSIAEYLRKPALGIFVEPVAGIPDRLPGETSPLAVDLTPGRYGLFCFVKDSDGRSHVNKGMAADFVVR